MQNQLWSIGFRPFFLFGSFLSIGLVLYWASVYFLGQLPAGTFDPIYWHAHEMIYGFVLAIVAGFLLTASANWTRSTPVSGTKLKWVFSIWCLGRLAFLVSIFNLPIDSRIYSFIDLSFIPVLIFVLAPPLIKSREIKNIQFLIILSFMLVGNTIFHLASLEYLEFIWVSRGIYLAVQLILIILVIIGGRVIPFFTQNALPSAKPQKIRLIETGSIISVWLYVITNFSAPDNIFLSWIALLAGVINGVRLFCWKPWQTLRSPLLWILHVGYLWIVSGFFLVFLSGITGLLSQASALHAFTTGAIGTFIIGMMSRVSLGHTGRPLVLPKHFIYSYFFIVLSGIIRVGAGFFPDLYNHGILCSGILWSISFLLFVIFYGHILLTPRPDGKAA